MMFFGGGMMIVWLLGLVGVIAAIVRLGNLVIRNRQADSLAGQPPVKETPEDILRVRYARGELSREDYLQMQATLKS